MAGNSELDRLRAEALARHAAATRKISRLRREKGVELTGSVFDLRRDVNRIKRYNKQQLNNYINELLGFTSRKTQFVAGSEGKPISAAKWREYKKLETEYNNYVAKVEGTVADMNIPTINQTIAERKGIMPKKAYGGAVNEIYGYENRESPKNITGQASLDAIMEKMKTKMRASYNPKKVKAARAQLNEMLVKIGDYGYLEKVKQLTNNQLDILFHYSKEFAGAVSMKYHLYKMISTSEAENRYARQIEDADSEINVLLDWAAQLPRRRTT